MIANLSGAAASMQGVLHATIVTSRVSARTRVHCVTENCSSRCRDRTSTATTMYLSRAATVRREPW